MKDTPVLALKIIEWGRVFGAPFYGSALSCNFVYLTIPGTRTLFIRNKICLFYLYEAAKSKSHICSNKHETGLAWGDIKILNQKKPHRALISGMKHQLINI